MWRATLVLLLLAALSGAPSRASAGSNALADPTVTPVSGSTLTIFIFSVRYDGTFPATTVTAAVAGLDLAMALADGSMDAGTWVASSTLPAGAWATTFIAYAEQGNVATATGPALTVAPADAVTPAPATPGTPGPSSPERHIETSRQPASEAVPAATPVAAPAQPAPSTGVEPSVAPSSAPDAAVPPGLAMPVTTETDPPSVGGLSVSAGSVPSIGPSAVAARSGTASGQATGMTRPTAGETGEAARAGGPIDEGASIIVLIGVLGVGAVALIGTATLIARRRRTDVEKEPVAETAAAALQRRTVRRARQRMSEDPIMAAMGIGAEDQRRDRGRRAPVDENRS